MKRFSLIGLIAFLSLASAHAQLGITEAMTGETDKNHPDWWELKNYGTNDIDLTGYSWNDDSHGGLSGADSAPFSGVTIHAGETILVTEIKGVVTDAASFRAWWGLSGSVQVVVLNSADPGLGDTGDSIRLWSTNLAALGTATNGLDLEQAPEFLVQRVDTIDIGTLGADGRSITYNTNDGSYSIISTNGILGAFVAATTADVSSPGVAPDPTPVTITQVPVGRTNTVGDTVTFTNAGFSLPPLQYHWYFGSTPIDSRTPGVQLTYTNHVSILTLSDVQLTNAGTYSVVAANGLQSFTNTAVLAVVAAPTRPTISAVTPGVSNFDAFLGQSIVLGVTASGFPAPAYQWKTNNVAIPDATNSQLTVSFTDTNQTAVYSVDVSNGSGSTNAAFDIRVTPVPALVVTEVMSSESTNNSNGDTSAHGDWFELSNLGNFSVNLHGFRIDDSHQSLGQSATVTNQATIQPSESVVFVQNMTPAAFRAWWGTNLPSTTQIIAYNGSGQGLSGTADSVFVWNAVATDANGYVASASFTTASNGVSFGFDPYAPNNLGFYGDIGSGGLSTNGMNGAFAAVVGGDIGSPGTIVNLPTITSIARTNGGYAIAWINQPNWSYLVQYKTNLTDSNWTTLQNVTSDGSAVFGIVDPTVASQRFYRVSLTP